MRTILPAFLLLAGSATAQWATPDVNTRVSGPGNVGAAVPLVAPGPDGSTYIAWHEAASGYRLMMQRLDADGVALWDEGGIVVSDAPQNSALFRSDMKGDHAGNTIVAFQDERSGQLDIVAYRVAPDGTLLWGDGLALPTPGTTGLAPVIGVLADDRVVIAWNTGSSPATVAYRILPATGMPAAEDPVEIGGSGIHGRPKVVPTADGGFWLQYVHQPGNFLSPGTMHAVRFNVDGEELLTTVVSTATITGFYFPEPVGDGSDGFYVAFNTGNAANPSMTDVVVQRVRADGTTWSATGTPVENGAATNRYANNTAPALIDDDAGLMIAYSRKNGAQSEGGVHVQRFDTAGTALLGPDGAEVIAMSNALPEPFGTVATPAGAVFGCTMGGFGTTTAGAYHVGLDGAMELPAPVPLAATPSGIDDAAITPFHAGQAVAVWQDDRHGGSVLAQPVQLDFGVGVADHGGPAVTLLHGPEAVLHFGQATHGPVHIALLGADGRLLHERQLPPQGAGARVPLHMPAQARGVLLVRITDIPPHGGTNSTVLRTVH
ncbi:MAG: hypothetical protein RBT71_09215 [Flavobacteriales bacterium]|jgi:hypothetical protein|nr:hypothetical protein [Flavobacteriales bacterium]